MSGNPYLVFAGLAAVVVLMPGADTILVFRSSRAYGTRTGVTTAAGVVTGPVIWGMLSGVGVALIITHNATLYTVVAILGALYLMYLSAGCFRAAANGSTAVSGEPAVDPADGAKGNPYVTGLLTNLLNPKIGVFYLSVMPGLFAGRRLDIWVGGSLGLIQSCLGFAFLSFVAFLAGKARKSLVGRRTSTLVETLAGLCLLAFAAYTIWSVSHSPHLTDAIRPEVIPWRGK